MKTKEPLQGIISLVALFAYKEKMIMPKILYREPAEYFPKEIRDEILGKKKTTKKPTTKKKTTNKKSGTTKKKK